MRQLVQSVRDGSLSLIEGPRPSITSTQVLVDTRVSLISSGTERHIRRLAKSSLVAKARARPDLVRKVVQKARTDGLVESYTAIRNRLSEHMPLGYSAAGVAIEVGEAVVGIRPGQRVATAGAGHGDLQVSAGNLTAPIPEKVGFDDASFGAVASIALHGLRLAEIGPADRIVVVGLGLVGQIVTRLGLAAGASVAGTDLIDSRLEQAAQAGAVTFPGNDRGWNEALDWTKGQGADAVIVTAATSKSEPMLRAAEIARDRGSIVVVGDTGLALDRRPLYDKEITIKVARSYGPGRYSDSYERWGVDLPIGYVRWSAGRNIEAILHLMESEKLKVADLVTHRYPFHKAELAYERLDESAEADLGMLLTYEPYTQRRHAPEVALPEEERIRVAGHDQTAALSSGLIGAGRFTRSTLLPAAQQAGFGPWTSIASAGGTSATALGKHGGFAHIAQDASEVITDPRSSVVFIASRHDSHADLVSLALREGKHVFCEKPLAISFDELMTVSEAYAEGSGALMVGFNRRWAPAIQTIQEHVGEGTGPLQVIYRINAGPLPDDHWLNDRRMGGRLIGEGCHFIDTCTAIIGQPPVSVYTIRSGHGEALLDQAFTILLSYQDGSQATVVYASADATSVGKEQVEVIGRERWAKLDDYSRLILVGPGGRDTRRYKPADKGHNAELKAFREIITGSRDGRPVADDAILSSRATLAAAESMLSGAAIQLSREP